MTRAPSIAFRDIPGHSRLFLEYLEGSPAALSFYAHPPVLGSLERAARDAARFMPAARQALVSVLARQNRAFGSGEVAHRHIEDLSDAGCVAVVTGQQAGLFGGPLYTVYKALTAIELARGLRAGGIRAVPVFWIECEDHDLAEVSHFSALDPAGIIREFQYAETLYGSRAAESRPVGSLILPEKILDVRSDLRSLLAGTPHLDAAESLIADAYRPGEGFADAFGGALARLFRGQGLVLLNPREKALKPLLAPLLERCVREAATLQEMLERRNGELQAHGYHGQVGVPEGSTLLFFQDGDQRRSVVREASGFHLKNSQRRFSAAELAALAAAEPGLFSPNVLLRPIVQDYLLPTAAYVAGPAEIAYFAQAEVLYRHFGRPMPVIWPRCSFTILDAAVRSAMDDLGIGLKDCLAGQAQLFGTIVQRFSASEERHRISALGTRIESTFEGLRPAFRMVNPSLEDAAGTARRKIVHNVSRLQRSCTRREERDHASIKDRLDWIASRCFPRQSLQERVFGAYEFLARHGPPLLDILARRADPAPFEHRILEIQ